MGNTYLFKPSDKMHEKPLFAENDHLATARLLIGQPIRPTIGFTSDRVLLLSKFTSEAVRKAIEDGKSFDSSASVGAMERFWERFREAYWEELGPRLADYGKRADSPTVKAYDERHVPGILSLDGRNRDLPRFLANSRNQELLWRYVESVVAKVLNAAIFSGGRGTPDLFLHNPQTDERIYVEVKSTRYSNDARYLTGNGNVSPVSRRGFFLKRNQTERQAECDGSDLFRIPSSSYVALVDYDFRNGAKETFEQMMRRHREVFRPRRLREYSDAANLLSILPDIVELKRVTLFPNLAAVAIWNRHVLKARPLRGKTKTKQRLDDTAIYFERRQFKEAVELMERLGIAKRSHVVTGAQPGETVVESYGHRFLPDDRVTVSPLRHREK